MAHLFWSDKRAKIIRIQVPNIAAIAQDCVGCIRESEITDGIVFGIFVNGNQQVVGAVVREWGVKLDGDPAVIIGRDCPRARKHDVFFGNWLVISSVFECASRHIFQINNDVAGVFGVVTIGETETDGFDVSGIFDFAGEEDLLGE